MLWHNVQTKYPAWLGVILPAMSGVLLVLTMPGYLDVGIIGWFALVPLLLCFDLFPDRKTDHFALPFGLVWSIGSHYWFVNIMGPWGALLAIGVGFWYALMIGLGIKVQRSMPGIWKLFALPIIWSGLEFAKFIAPVVRDWWFVPLANSQWLFPPALQILSITGFPGLSFLLMLSNVALTALIVHWWGASRAEEKSGLNKRALVVLLGVVAILLWGSLSIPEVPEDTFTIVATSDLANAQDIQQYSRSFRTTEGYYADTPEQSQAIFDVNAALTRQAVTEANDDVAFVVWPENEFADTDDAFFMNQVGALARELNTHIVADTVWRTPTDMHDTAVMFGPDGNEIGRQAKVHLFSGEREFGFTAGVNDGKVFETPYGRVGLGVCYDYHYIDVVQKLARNGATIMLMPTDDDMNSDDMFPFYHAADAIFRAVEHRVAFASAGTNGISLVVDPYGRFTAMSGVNERTAVYGETFTVQEQTLYTRFGDWFGWLMIIGAAGLFIVNLKRNKQK